MALDYKFLTEKKSNIKIIESIFFPYSNNDISTFWWSAVFPWHSLSVKFLFYFPKARHKNSELLLFVNSYKFKIILQIVISAVWLTNFLSEIRNLINPWWWVEQLLLSVKRCENSCKDISHIDDRLLPTCGKQMEKLLSEWFSGHFSYTALVGCPKERNNFLHSHKYTAWYSGLAELRIIRPAR